MQRKFDATSDRKTFLQSNKQNFLNALFILGVSTTNALTLPEDYPKVSGAETALPAFSRLGPIYHHTRTSHRNSPYGGMQGTQACYDEWPYVSQTEPTIQYGAGLQIGGGGAGGAAGGVATPARNRPPGGLSASASLSASKKAKTHISLLFFFRVFTYVSVQVFGLGRLSNRFARDSNFLRVNHGHSAPIYRCGIRWLRFRR